MISTTTFLAITTCLAVCLPAECVAQEDYLDIMTAMCERNDRTLYRDISNCIRLTKNKVIKEATKDCFRKAYPPSNGEFVTYFPAACRDNSIVEKYKDCMKTAGMSDDALASQLLAETKVTNCIARVLMRNNIRTQ